MPEGGSGEALRAEGGTGAPSARVRTASRPSRMGLAWPAAFVVVYFLVFAYPPLSMLVHLSPASLRSSLLLGAILSGPALLWLLGQRVRAPVRRLVLRTAYTWLGVCFVALPIIGVWDALGLVAGFERASGPGPLAWVPVALTVLAVGWGMWNAHRLTVRRLRIPVGGLGRPLRLVQVSDIHVGSRTPRFLERVVRRVNALEPDRVVITGDLVDLHGIGEGELAPLARLAAPTMLSIGNHERYVDCDLLCERIARQGVEVLRNRIVEAEGIQWVGIDDGEGRDQVARWLGWLRPDPGRPAVLLYHRPDGAEDAARHGIDLMLCGHTHNGQIRPFDWVVRRVFPRIAGLHRVDRTLLYVSPGTGTWGPWLRLGSRNEVTLIELVPA